jgi:hypothetical protein
MVSARTKRYKKDASRAETMNCRRRVGKRLPDVRALFA